MHFVDSRGFGHMPLPSGRGVLVPGKEPSQEVHCRDGHSDTEKHAGKRTLRAAFTEGEGEPGHDNRDQGRPHEIVLVNTSASSDQGQSCCHFPSLPVGEESSESHPLILLMGKKPAKSFKEKYFTF